jgi:hypothetical protein
VAGDFFAIIHRDRGQKNFYNYTISIASKATPETSRLGGTRDMVLAGFRFRGVPVEVLIPPTSPYPGGRRALRFTGETSERTVASDLPAWGWSFEADKGLKPLVQRPRPPTHPAPNTTLPRGTSARHLRIPFKVALFIPLNFSISWWLPRPFTLPETSHPRP